VSLRKLFAALALSLLALGSLPVRAADQIAIGEPPWTSAVVIGHILGHVIHDRLGYDVSYVTGNPASLLAAISKGDGTVDIEPEIWLPNASGLWAKYIGANSNKTVLVNDHPYIGEQGLYIPGYIQDEHGVRSVSDLTRPEVAALFAPPGGGKPQIFVGAPGWGSTPVEQVKAKSYGYDKQFEEIFTDTPVTYAAVKAAFAAHGGIVFSAGKPEAIHVVYDLRRLQEPPFDGYAMDSRKEDAAYNPKGCWNMVTPVEDPDWLNKSRITCAWPDAKIYTAYSKTLTERAPRVAKLISQFTIDPDTVTKWLLRVDIEKADPDVVAAEWLATKPAVVEQWLAGVQ
jgi:glycine betaine/proline transport system substrate-binding protein